MRILIVEDEPTLGPQLKATLEGAGYAVDLATDGEDGHFLGSTETYDAAILDLGLPDEDPLLPRAGDSPAIAPQQVLREEQAPFGEEADRQRETIRRRRAQYNEVHDSVNLAGRTIIVVDDGLATGTTMCAALQEVRACKPARLICAVPVGSPEAIARVRPLCEAVVCLAIESDFGGVGQFYRDFRQVEDEAVLSILKDNS